MPIANALPPAGADGRPDALHRQPSAAMRRAAQDFESVFLAEILRGMSQGLTGAGPLGAGKDDPFGSMLQDEYAKVIARRGGIGIADAVLREMVRAQASP